MAQRITIHYDNALGFGRPRLWAWYAGSGEHDDLAPTGEDAFGPVFELDARRPDLGFKFKDGPGAGGPWEGPGLDRAFRRYLDDDGHTPLGEVWCKADRAFVYPAEPRGPEPISAADFLAGLTFHPGTFVPDTGGRSGLGATVLADGRVLFGLYQPNAARVYVIGSFNDWQRPSHAQPDPCRFVELSLYRGYFGLPNVWLGVADAARPGDEYKFCVLGGVPSDDKNRLQRCFTDPYARQLGPDFGFNNAVVVDPTGFAWNDEEWRTPDIADLILYELSVYGFTEGDPDVAPADRGTFRGISERIRAGYFGDLGVNALALMPLAEVPSPQGPTSLGYDPSLYLTVERDFGQPDDLRALVDEAHGAGLAVILDQVFNHTSSGFNPLWQMILEHPDEQFRSGEGGLYFHGSTPWGNRVDTAKEDVQNLLIDACKLWLREYHVDGFRFDATHHDDYMDGRFLQRLAHELRAFKPDVILIAENLPNQSDLNRRGFDGYAQWSDPFHDKLKALLREGQFQGSSYSPDGLGDVFYFSKASFAAHTNNVVNYTESHDETSIPFEVGTNPALNNGLAKERKGRLGLFAALVALGQPMLYMGQEFNVERDRNFVQFTWPPSLAGHGFYQWVRRLVHLRRRYPGLRLRGYDPGAAGQFVWIVAPWLDGARGGGQKAIGWRAHPNQHAHDALAVLLNFEGHDVRLDLDLGIPGTWVKLADLDRVNDLPPHGTNAPNDPTALRTRDGRYVGFTLPSSSGFIYKWEAGP